MDQWIQRKQRDSEVEVGYAYVTENCSIPPGTQVEVPVEISRPTWRTVSDCWATEPIQISEGVSVERSLFGADALKTVGSVVNLSSESYELHQDQLLSEATRVEFVRGMLPIQNWGGTPTQIYAETSCKAS